MEAVALWIFHFLYRSYWWDAHHRCCELLHLQNREVHVFDFELIFPMVEAMSHHLLFCIKIRWQNQESQHLFLRQLKTIMIC